MATSPNHSPALEKFFSAGTRLAFSKGEYIIRPEEDPSGVFYIETGFVKAISTTKYGEENILVIRRSGEVFPLIWVVTGDNRNVGYVAHTDCRVLRRSHAELEAAMNNDTQLMRAILVVTTTMYQSQAERVSSLVYRTVRERIAYFLRTLVRRFGVECPEGIMIDAPLTRQDIASSLSATRETVSREFSYLQRKGIVKQINGKIVVIDLEALESIL
ncbi:Crp/Fnr family transcriptional regulator [Candidatus Saccharibacteria bacterium]|nr:Crp/Fnr family transcriptional regulator [Candidatus Saccharibacteria bacterium]MCB9821218.1 Crp/Fnr family transcriptional regulator [Candidatus Nomurabacteria bacterium]